MSDVVAELASALKLSDPLPSHCAACFAGADSTTRFVDFDAAIDRGAIVDEGSLAVLDSIDELHLCEACVRSAAEVLAFKPELHRRQLREIKRLETHVEYWRERAARAEKAEKDAHEFVETRLGGIEAPASSRRKAA